MSSIPENLSNIRQQISLFEKKYDRHPHSVQLLAVSKTQSVNRLIDAIATGMFHFGENYVQEAMEKIALLEQYPLTWHFIGPIQSNKTRMIAESFDWIHSVDRARIIQRLGEQRPANLPPLNILLQVKLEQEDTKSGADLCELADLADQVSSYPTLSLKGLMAIPAPGSFDDQRAKFRLLAGALEKLQQSGHVDCQQLSMGMSNDYEAAIAEGATIIRIGTGIFGERTRASS